jgi:hypothetical protein
MVLFKEIISIGIAGRTIGVFMVGPAGTAFFVGNKLKGVGIAAGISDRIGLLVDKRPDIQRRGRVVDHAVGGDLGQFCTRRVIGIGDIALRVDMYLLGQVHVIVRNAADRLVVVLDQIAIAVIVIVCRL